MFPEVQFCDFTKINQRKAHAAPPPQLQLRSAQQNKQSRLALVLSFHPA
jgi:hypothetical protein